MTLRRLICFGTAIALFTTLGECQSSNPDANSHRDMAGNDGSMGTGDMSTGSTDDMGTGMGDMSMSTGDMSMSTGDMSMNPGMDLTVPPDLTPLPAPTITAIMPASASNAGGAMLAITGTGFQMGATVTVAGAACGNVVVFSATQITCTVPAKAMTCGLVAVKVTNPDTQSATNNTAFSYKPSKPGFGAAANYAVSTGPAQVLITDLNKDGKLDLVSSDGGTNLVSVLLGKGDGTFGAATNFSVGSAVAKPALIALGDVNNDAKLDLVATLPGTSSYSVLLGDGAGGFGAASPTTFIGFTTPTGVALDDLNGDNKLDLVLTDTTTMMSSMGVMLGNGDGTFGTLNTFTMGTTPAYVALADFNGDGKLDAVTANSGSNDIGLRLGDGKGNFPALVNFPMGTGANYVAAVDVNGDGKLDVITANPTANNLSVRLGNGVGSFGAVTNFPTGAGTQPSSVAIADFNGDAILDLASANYASGTISVLTGMGNGTFNAAMNFAMNTQSGSVAAADFNNDKFTDVVTTSTNTNTLTVRLGQCN